MRIAFFLPTFPEISNTFILNQITGLLDRGHEVDLFAIEARSFEATHADVQHYDLRSRMRHIPVPKGRWDRFRSAIALLLSPRGLNTASLDAINPLRHGRDALALVQLHTVASFRRAATYDVVHCQFGHLGPAAQRLVSTGAVRAPLVTSFRGADLTVHVPSRPDTFRDLFRRGEVFLPISRHFAERLIAMGVSPDRVLVHHSGVDVRRFRFAPRVHHGGSVELLFVGRLVEKKGADYALDAVARIVADGRDVRLTIIGDGPLENTLRSRCAELGVAERVVFLGAGTQEDVIAIMQAAHILIAPSITAADGDQEGIPNVVKEAMATGMPVVSTVHSGIPELVEHGVSGLLAPERDAGALAAHLVTMLDHPEHWPAFGHAGRHMIEQSFDANRLNDELVRIYQGLLVSL